MGAIRIQNGAYSVRLFYFWILTSINILRRCNSTTAQVNNSLAAMMRAMIDGSVKAFDRRVG